MLPSRGMHDALETVHIHTHTHTEDMAFSGSPKITDWKAKPLAFFFVSRDWGKMTPDMEVCLVNSMIGTSFTKFSVPCLGVSYIWDKLDHEA